MAKSKELPVQVCPECKKTLTGNYITCPFCGKVLDKWKNFQKKHKFLTFLYKLTIVLVFLFVFFCMLFSFILF